MLRLFERRRWLVVLGAVGMLMVGAGIAYATIPNSGVINGCYTRSGGTLRVIDGSVTQCKSSETALAWNVQGAPGTQGPQGLQGPQGPQGPQGTAGAAGVSGRQVVRATFTVPKGNNSMVVNAICPAGKYPTGGGYNTGFDGANEVLSSRPGPFTDGTDGWQVNLGQDADVDVDITVFAVCASVG